MELQGINSDGAVVAAPIRDLADSLVRKGETYQLGSTPTHVVYTNNADKSTREIDLQQVAQATGLRNVQFNFDHDSAQKQGFLQQKDVDFGTAYNLERIKTDDLKHQYLADQGYGKVLQDRDNFYNYDDKSGKITPINNKDGLDASDGARILAHLGRDVVASTAAGAVIGGSAVATGGPGIVGGIAAAGAAGAAGGVAGEAAQRLIDRILGTKSAEYNAKIGTADDLKSYAGDAGMGAISGALQPIGNAAMGAVGSKLIAPAKQAGADALESVSPELSEWLSKSAAKTKINAAMTRLPQGYMQQYSTPAEAGAMDAMQSTLKGLEDGSVNSSVANDALDEAQSFVRPGSMKGQQSLGAAGADSSQSAMRDQYASTVLGKNAAEQAAKAQEAAAQQAVSDRAQELVAKGQENAIEQLGAAHKKELETLFDDGASRDLQQKAQNTILTQRAAGISKEGGGMQVEALSGNGTTPTGYNSRDMNDFGRETADEVFNKSQEFLSGHRTNGAFLDTVPSASVKGQAVSDLRMAAGGVRDKELKSSLNDVISSISDHGVNQDGGINALRDAIDEFHSQVYSTAGKSGVPRQTQQSLSSAMDALKGYEANATSDPALVNSHYDVAKQLLSAKGMSADGVQSPASFDAFVEQLHNLSKTVGDTTPVEQLAKAHTMNDILAGNPENAKLTKLLDPQVRDHMDAIRYVRDFTNLSADIIPSSSNFNKRLVGAVGGAIAAKTMGGSALFGAAEGFIAGKGLPDSMGNFGKIGAQLGSKALGLTVKGASATGSALTSPVTTSAGRAALIDASEESYLQSRKR